MTLSLTNLTVDQLRSVLLKMKKDGNLEGIDQVRKEISRRLMVL